MVRRRNFRMKVKELKAALKEMGLSTKGKKLELENRYVEAMVEEETVVEEAPVEEVEEAPVEEVEEVVEEAEEEPAAPDMDGGENCECEWCGNGYAHR